MKQRPWPIVLLAILHVLSSPGNFIFNAWISKVNLMQKLAIYWHPVNQKTSILFFALPLIGGLMIYICKRWSFYVFTFTNLCLAALSIYGYSLRPGRIPLLALVVILLVDLVVVSYFMIPAVRKIYFDPRLRWWDTKPRYKSDIKAKCKVEDTEEVLDGVISNFSEGGLFFQTKSGILDDKKAEITFEFEGETVNLVGKIIHHQARASMGFGFQFVEDLASKAACKRIVKSLDKQELRIHLPPPNPEERFYHWLKTFVRTGKGFFPGK